MRINELGKPANRSRLAETAAWTACGLALYPFVERIRLGAPGLKDEPADYEQILAELTRILKAWTGPAGKFVGVAVLGERDGVPGVEILSRRETGGEFLWTVTLDGTILHLDELENVFEEDPLVLAEALLAEPLAGLGHAEDVQLKITEPYIDLHGGRWLVAVGNPFWDELGHPMTGVQAARDRAYQLASST